MGNRMIRDWTKSDRMDLLSSDGERFFTRLIMKADDFGFYYADTRILKADLFPLKLDKIREADLLRWLDECQKAGLIVLYEASGKKYLYIIDFGQRKRIMKSKFPTPPTIVSSPRTDVRTPPPEGEEEIEVEKEEEGNKKAAPDLTNSNLFRKPKRPEFESVHMAFLNAGGTKEMAQKFFDSFEATGWFFKGSPVTNFVSMVPGYINTWKENLEKNENRRANDGKGGKGTSAARVEDVGKW